MKLWCAMCGKYGDHQSGSCPELRPALAMIEEASQRKPNHRTGIQRDGQANKPTGDK